MKIGAKLDTAAGIDLPQRAPRTDAAAAPATAGVTGDRVALSAAGASIASAGGDFDPAKVEAIRAAIKEGRFSVNAGAIADRLIADATALLGPRS